MKPALFREGLNNTIVLLGREPPLSATGTHRRPRQAAPLTSGSDGWKTEVRYRSITPRGALDLVYPLEAVGNTGSCDCPRGELSGAHHSFLVPGRRCPDRETVVGQSSRQPADDAHRGSDMASGRRRGTARQPRHDGKEPLRDPSITHPIPAPRTLRIVPGGDTARTSCPRSSGAGQARS
jgi:hypothetical protein